MDDKCGNVGLNGTRDHGAEEAGVLPMLRHQFRREVLVY
jgi:hypothetical protein